MRPKGCGRASGRAVTVTVAVSLAVSLALVLAPAAFLAAPARAAVLSEDALEESSTEIGAVLRAFSFVLTGTILEPPLSPVDANPSGIAFFDVRGYFAHKTPSLSLVLHAQLTSSMRSHALGSALAIGRGAAPPRWLPLRVRVVDEDTMAIIGAVDWVYAAWTHGPVTVTLGRQPVTFGRAKLWSPTDLVSTFALTEVDTEYKPGADALRVDWSAGQRLAFTLVAAPGELDDDGDAGVSVQGSTVLARGRWGWDGGEIGALLGAVRGDAVLGGDAVLDMGSFELYGEATATVITGKSVAAPATESGDVVARAVLGATFRPSATLTLGPELLYNGFGASSSQDYLATVQSDRVSIGEQLFLGTHYLGLIASWQAHPLLQVGGAALGNLRDPSGLVSVAVQASLSDNTAAVFGGYVGLGERPELDPAGPQLSIRDEFGLYPGFLFAELKAVY
jgi:hypothetical protein